jgi:hypothetical protein
MLDAKTKRISHDGGIKALTKRIQSLGEYDVAVGIFPENNPRGGGIGNAALGAIHEKGSPRRNIPPRPWLVPVIEKNQDDLANEMAKSTGDVLRNGKAPQQAFKKVADRAKMFVKKNFNNNDWARLSKATAERRLSQGKQLHVLQDTGRFRAAIDAKVIKK